LAAVSRQFSFKKIPYLHANSISRLPISTLSRHFDVRMESAEKYFLQPDEK
jgi:hypothetical protein